MATLRSMDRHGGLDPDVGYWAARWDPTGRLHPLYDTVHIGDRWVLVTTVPMLYLGHPLYQWGGYRLALLLPMAGAIAAALAAKALARRLGGGDGWIAFWVVAVASPLAIYALDFWEHAVGVGLMAWGVVLLLDVGRGAAGWRAAAGAGLLFGAAATLRQEAFVYGAIAAACGCVWLLVRTRSFARAVLAGFALVVALAVPLVGNQALETATLGGSLRAQRVSYTKSDLAGTAAGTRLHEAALTAVALQPALEGRSYLIGAVSLALLLLLARGSAQRGRQGPAVVAAAGLVVLYAIRFADGWGFVPGMTAAWPLAAVGLAWATRSKHIRFVALVALLSLPLVWGLEFPGGASPQWAGRYILMSGFLLTVVGLSVVGLLAGWARLLVLALAFAVTGFGLGWLAVRSHDIGDAGRALDRRPEPVLVSRVAHLAREEGAYYGDKRWLTAVTDKDERQAASVLQDAGVTQFAVIRLVGEPLDLPGFSRRESGHVRLLAGIPLRLTTYTKSA